MQDKTIVVNLFAVVTYRLKEYINMVGYDDYRDRSYGGSRNQHGRGGRGRGTFKRRGYHSGGNRRGGYGRGFGRAFSQNKMESVDREKVRVTRGRVCLIGSCLIDSCAVTSFTKQAMNPGNR